MDKQQIIEALTLRYDIFADYITSLSEDEFLFKNGDKWTAGQQLKHIVLCVKPLVKVYSLPPQVIEQHFGKTGNTGRSYDVLLTSYKEQLGGGGKAPTQFVPSDNEMLDRETLLQELKVLLKTLCNSINELSEEELDTLLIPHPLLGKLTLREMLYNAIYHVQHHQEQAKQNLLAK